MIETLLAATSPVFEVDGSVRGELARDLLRLEVQETTEGMKTLRARFLAVGPRAGADEEQLLYLDGAIFDFGRALHVSMGTAHMARTVFRGFVSGIEVHFEESEEPEVVIHAEDRLMDLRMTRRMRTYENVTDADIAQQIADAHGIRADIAAEGPTYDRVQQWNMSDLAFLRERARLVRAEIWFQQETLHFMSRDQRPSTDLTLVRGNDIVSLQACADLAHQRTAVHVSGYNAADRALIDEQAGADAVQTEVNGTRTGPHILEEAFGSRISHRVREVPLTENEAFEWARAEMLRRARGFVQVAGTTRGSPDMVVGSLLTLERAGPPFSGPGYYVTSVRHTYDLENGYRTHFLAERATLEEAT
jgi:uncharacterized protein